jgi:hypothetical protein
MIESTFGLDNLGDWIRTGGIVALLAVVLNFYLKNKAGDRAGYGSLIEALEKRVAKLEESEQRCQAALTETRRELAELQGYMTGQGKAAQEAAGIVAIERQERKT